MSRHVTWLASLLWVTMAACSSSDTHPAFITRDCSQDCDPEYGSLTGGGRVKPKPDAGKTSTPEAGAVTGFGCFTDPTFGVTLCAGSLLCPGVTVDRTSPALQSCGFVDLGRASGAPDVECLCNGEFLCPITTAANCPTLPALLSQQTDVCSAAIGTNRCVDLATLTKRDAGACSASCLQSCGNAPICVSFCGC